MKYVIIGAGPAGLYTAIKLKQAGIKDVVIYDPRAGTYTRPGHLDFIVPKTINDSIGSHLIPVTGIHIKDLERHLYMAAKGLGIEIENKSFVRLFEDATAPGVVITDSTGVEEIVHTEYVFDCTGSKRQVIGAVNSLTPEPAFELFDMTDVPVSEHLIAHVKIPFVDSDRLMLATERSYADIALSMPPLTFARCIFKLWELGWNELHFPRCVVHKNISPEKNKVLIYLQAPRGLAAEDYDSWMKAVIACYTTPVTYEHLPLSKKYVSKPRFGSFIVSAQALTRTTYKREKLPRVTALGDAEIDADYFLGHGINDAVERINHLVAHLTVREGEIVTFSAEAYALAIQENLKAHQTKIIAEAENVRRAFYTAYQFAPLLIHASMLSDDVTEQEVFMALADEFKMRMNPISSHFYGLISPSAMTAETSMLTYGTILSFALAQPLFKELLHSLLSPALTDEKVTIAPLLQDVGLFKAGHKSPEVEVKLKAAP